MNSIPADKVIILTVVQSIGLLTCLLIYLLVTIFFLFQKKANQRSQGNAPDWSIPTIDAQADGTSLFHTWAPAVKIGVLFIFCFLIVSLKTLPWSGFALIIALLAVHLAKISWRPVLQRLTAMGGFLLMLLVILPLTSAQRPGTTVVLFPLLEFLPFRLAGIFLALTIILKACSVALLMEPMFATSPISQTLQGFTALGLPPALGQMILLCHRYLFVFQQETTRMQRSMRVRGFAPKTTLATMRTMGNCLGMLFIRSFERTERVYEAMLSRGYQGVFPSTAPQKITARDWIKGAVWIMIGLLLLAFDRLFPII